MDQKLRDTIKDLEESLLATDFRKSPEKVAFLLSDDFIEYSCSGQVLNKKQVIDALVIEPHIKRTLTDFTVTQLSSYIVLATYQARKHAMGRDALFSRRTSIWCWRDERWQLIFHQGTPIK